MLETSIDLRYGRKSLKQVMIQVDNLYLYTGIIEEKLQFTKTAFNYKSKYRAARNKPEIQRRKLNSMYIII